MIPRPLATGIIVLVSVVWFANFLLQFVVPGYQPDPTIHGIFGAIVGGALALSKQDTGKGKGRDDDGGTGGDSR